jgi:hypothetical protein
MLGFRYPAACCGVVHFWEHSIFAVRLDRRRFLLPIEQMEERSQLIGARGEIGRSAGGSTWSEQNSHRVSKKRLTVRSRVT